MRSCVSAVYAIRHRESGRVYVGSTQDVQSRWQHHRASLRRGDHGNSRLQRAWRKYGQEAFTWELLELVSVDELLECEQRWLDKLRSNGARLYNLAIHAGAPMRGRKHTQETLRILGQSRIGVPRSQETRQKIGDANAGAYPSFMHVASGKVEPAGMNLSEFCRQHSLTQGEMAAVKNGRKRSHKGWVVAGSGIVPAYRGPKPYPAFVNTVSGEVWPAGMNLTRACRGRDVDRPKMCMVKNGDRKSHKGWKLLKEE